MTYRDLVSTTWTEEELWQRLDESLEVSLVDPTWAWAIAWQVALDSSSYPHVRLAAAALMSVINGDGTH